MRGYLLIGMCLLLFLGGCNEGKPTSLEVQMYNAAGDMVGTATVKEGSQEVTIQLKVEGLSTGFHGIHIHENAQCEGPDFKTAGNHINPDGKQHGLLHPEGAHLGDLPNIEVDDSGMVETEVSVKEATLKDGKTSLLSGEGTSLIITEEADDGMTQPSGESGERLICGIISKKEERTMNEEPRDPTEEE